MNMVGIVRHAQVTFESEKDFKIFKKRILHSRKTVSFTQLQEKVKNDGIYIQH